MESHEPAPARAKRSLHWPIFVAGLVLFFTGPIAYAMQIRANNLAAPWYVPILASVGVALMGLSFYQKRGVIRAIAVLLFGLLCGFEWFSLLVATRSPAYSGPATPGHKLPAFRATFADGTAFTQKDLSTGVSTVLLFYRGHW